MSPGSIVLTLSDLSNNESFDPANLGEAETVSQEYISDKEIIFFRGTKNIATSSIILRGPNDYSLEEMER